MSGFGASDPNGNGLSLDEFVNYLKVTHGVTISKATAEQVFNDIDARNKDDNLITWQEWCEFQQAKSMNELSKEDLLREFDIIDKDGSGQISSQELLATLKDKGYSEADIEDIISQIDESGDKKLNKDEWSKLVNLLKKSD
ncbi:hypothetical protein Ahia01_000072000 [Argonauta hians]